MPTERRRKRPRRFSPTPQQHYRKIVDRFDRIARANLKKHMRISDLGRIARLHPRTLARAFKAIHGTTPVRYFRDLRLAKAREALSNADPATTVKEVALRLGFRELGRFAVEYRQQFGESPSETVRSAAGRLGG
jgi:transcriptional regulator GlxA family with amidase domain